jgi:hypothetical protein
MSQKLAIDIPEIYFLCLFFMSNFVDQKEIKLCIHIIRIITFVKRFFVKLSTD